MVHIFQLVLDFRMKSQESVIDSLPLGSDEVTLTYSTLCKLKQMTSIVFVKKDLQEVFENEKTERIERDKDILQKLLDESFN